MASEFLLEAEGVSKSFAGVPALRDGRFYLRPGEVHALCGGNGAGKSTFLNIIMGLLQRDAGSIRIGGEEVDFRSPSEAVAKRIAIITQELAPVRDMTVAENVYLGREPKRLGIVDHARMQEMAETLLAELRFNVPANAKMSTLSLAKIQLVEIARAISQNARVLIMDEPTSAIGEQEARILFDAIRRLTANGVGVVYVSHRLEELFEVADSYTVFRDGRYVNSGVMSDIDRHHLVQLIVGYEVTGARREESDKSFSIDDVLVVSKLSCGTQFKDISVSIRRGEIVGIYGLMGAGRSEFLNGVYGIGPRSSGTVKLKGAVLPPGRPDISIARGLTMVTEDRKDTGLVLTMPIRHNISLSVLKQVSRFSILRGWAEKALSARMIKKLSIKAANDRLTVGALSGGNQQKVVVSRCLSSNPDLLICDEPTRGIDEGAKQEIYRLLENFAAEGGAVLVCSSEAPEVLRLSSRVLIFKKGRLVSELVAKGLTQQSLLHEASS